MKALKINHYNLENTLDIAYTLLMSIIVEVIMGMVFKTISALVLFFESSDAMRSPDIMRELTMSVDTNMGAVRMQSTSSSRRIDMQMSTAPSGQPAALISVETVFSVFISDPLIEARVLSLLSSFNTDRFGVNPSLDFVLSEDSVSSFNDLFAELGASVFDVLPFCSATQVQRIIHQLNLCSGTSAQTAYTACSEFSERDEEEISKIEAYFNNVSDKLEFLIKMVSLMKE